MKYRIFISFVCLALISCTNGESDNQNSDSGNMLHDTLPAVAVRLDSMPADGTDVDSMNNLSR